jgi:hypothetical protein
MKPIFLFIATTIILTGCKLNSQSNDTDNGKEQFFYPGKIWYDTDNVPIEAHACGIIKVKDIYYMYGQDQRLGHGNKTGVCCYSSSDLYKWKYEGTVLPTIKTPEEVRDSGVLERPKVIYNARTGKYVMWMHLDGDGYTLSQAGVAVSGSPTGPFEFVKSFRPIKYDYGYNRMDGGSGVISDDDKKRIEKIDERSKGNTFRDMNLFVDDDGNGYVIYSSENNSTMYIVRLSDDYLSVVEPAVEGKTWSRAVIDKKREAPAIFKHKGKYFLITSGLTGWAPNPAGYFTADNIFGPWTSHGNPCIGPNADLTYGAQSTFVLPAPGKPEGCFIFMADVWDSRQLEKSTLLWLPFIMKENDTFQIQYLDRWSLRTFNENITSLSKPKVSVFEQAAGSSQKELQWGYVDGADGYRIYKNGKQIGNTSYNIFKLPVSLPGTKFECMVEAYTINGISEKSKIKNVGFSMQPSSNNELTLTEFEPDSVKQGFSNLHINQSVNGSPLIINGKKFEIGFGTRAVSEIVYSINGNYSRFTSWIGVDACASRNDLASIGFIIKGDGKELYRSGLMTVKDEAVFVDISIKDIHRLELIVSDGGNGTRNDIADWCEPKVYIN